MHLETILISQYNLMYIYSHMYNDSDYINTYCNLVYDICKDIMNDICKDIKLVKVVPPTTRDTASFN